MLIEVTLENKEKKHTILYIID